MAKTLPTLEQLRHELIQAMGATLIKLQFFELYLSGCLLDLSPGKNYSTDDLFSGDATRRAPSLGILISGLRRVIPLHPQFEDRLGAFIENRNFFIHRFFVADLARHNQPTTEAHIYEKLSFLLELMREADSLKPIFTGLNSLRHKAQIETGVITVDGDLAAYAAENEVYEQHFLSILKSTNNA